MPLIVALTGLPPVSEIKKRRGAYLPHWTRDIAWYAVTFRLWDSLPQHVIESWLMIATTLCELRASPSRWHYLQGDRFANTPNARGAIEELRKKWPLDKP